MVTKGVSFGVADGVGGWIDSGVDPSLFSQALMYHQNWKASSSAVILRIALLPWELFDRARTAYQKWKTWNPEALRRWRKWQSDTHTARNWREFENQLARAEVLKEEDKLMMLAEADELIMDDAFLSKVVRPCLQQSSLESALPVVHRILRHRAHKVGEARNRWDNSIWSTCQWFTSEQDSVAIISMGDLCLDVFRKYTNSWRYTDDHSCDHLLQLIRAMPPTDSSRAFCRRATHFIQWAVSCPFSLHESRIEVLDNGADEFVVTAGFKALPGRVQNNDLDPFYNILARRLDSTSNMDSKTSAAAADLILDLLLKSPLHPRAIDLLECLSRHDVVSHALSFGEDNQSVYTRLVDILCTTQSTEKLTNRILDWVWFKDRYFSLNIEYTRKLLAYLPTARDHLSADTFLKIASFALTHSASAKHSSSSFIQILEDVTYVLDIVSGYFSSSDIDEVARKIIKEQAWHALSWLLNACTNLAESAADLFNRDIIRWAAVRSTAWAPLTQPL
ncbi:predicted protein [Postia placenta Mad-698-R]|nr:predicted protein [Postia placenta Mad-698-R]